MASFIFGAVLGGAVGVAIGAGVMFFIVKGGVQEFKDKT